MKLLHVLAAATLSAVSCSTVSAADCTMDDVDGTGPPHSFYTVCTNIYTETNSTLTFSDWTAMNETRLAGLKPCGEKACIDEFTKYVEVAPNCEFWGTNYRQLYNTTLQVCKKFSEGSVTVADFNAIFHDLLANTSVEFKMFMEGTGPRDPRRRGQVQGRARQLDEHDGSSNSYEYYRRALAIANVSGCQILFRKHYWPSHSLSRTCDGIQGPHVGDGTFKNALDY